MCYLCSTCCHLLPSEFFNFTRHIFVYLLSAQLTMSRRSRSTDSVSSSSSEETPPDVSQMALFSCLRCTARHRFEDLTPDEMLCLNCQDRLVDVKCNYCRAEFRQDCDKGETFCEACYQNLSEYGLPSSCKYCNLVSAFQGDICDRCTQLESEFGAPVPCSQCSLMAAFQPIRNDPTDWFNRNVPLCWLCSLAYRIPVTSKTSSSCRESAELPQNHRTPLALKRVLFESTTESVSTLQSTLSSTNAPPTLTATKPPPPTQSVTKLMEAVSQDNMATIVDLTGKIECLEQQLKSKEYELIQKQISQLKAEFKTERREWALKTRQWNKKFTEQQQIHAEKVASLAKELAILKKSMLNKKILIRKKKKPVNGKCTEAEFAKMNGSK